MALFEFAALLVAAPVALRAVGIPLGWGCQQMLTGFAAPAGIPVGLTAAGVAALVPVLAWRGAATVRRAGREAREALRVGEHTDLPDGTALLVLPDKTPLAVSVPGRPPCVVVSEGLVEALDDGQFRAVCDHEAAHLRLGHDRYLALAMATERAFGLWPPARRSVTALRVALERWADEAAVAAAPGRRSVIRSALLAVALAPADGSLAALSGTAGFLERLDALEHPPEPVSPAGRAVLYAPGLALTFAAIVSLAVWSNQAYCTYSMNPHCMP